MDIVCKIQNLKIGQVSGCALSYLSKSCLVKNSFRAFRNADAFRNVFLYGEIV